jgi:hypothetical protein
MLEREDIKILKNILSIDNKQIDFDLLYNILTVIKDYPNLTDDLFDSFSDNQFASKGALIDAVNRLNILNKESTVVIWGSWYGSILIPSLADKVKKVISIDLDNTPLQIAKNQLFKKYKNVDYICDDVFKTCRKQYLDTNLIINTSCEHMPPMKEWKWFGPGALKEDGILGKDPKLSSNCYFAFQSNNMFGIEGHVNCVNSLEEFKDQMPKRAKILYEEEVKDTRGTRYMLVGKFMPL